MLLIWSAMVFVQAGSQAILGYSNKKVMAELARVGDAEASLLFCFDRQVR